MASRIVELIQYWEESGKDFNVGLGIWLDYGRKNISIRNTLLSAQAKGKIQPKHYERLDWELTQIKLEYIAQHYYDPVRENAKKEIEQAARQTAETRQLTEDEIGLMGNLRNPYAAISQADILIYDRRMNAQKRALLTNQLQKDGGDPAIIKKNIEILAEIEPLETRIKQIEARLEELENPDGVQTETVTETGWEQNKESTVLIRLGYGNSYREYTYGDIMRMSLSELKELIKKVRDAKSKSSKRSKPGNRHVKLEKSRVMHEKMIAVREKEMEMLNIIKASKEEKRM